MLLPPATLGGASYPGVKCLALSGLLLVLHSLWYVCWPWALPVAAKTLGFKCLSGRLAPCTQAVSCICLPQKQPQAWH